MTAPMGLNANAESMWAVKVTLRNPPVLEFWNVAFGLSALGSGRVARAASCSFLLTASMAQSIPPLEFTGELRNEGAPRVGFTRGGLHHAEGFEALLWTWPSTFPHVQLLSAAAAAQHPAGAKPLRPHPRQDS